MDGWMPTDALMLVDIDDMIDQNHAPLPNERRSRKIIVVKHFIDSTESTQGVKLQDLLLL